MQRYIRDRWSILCTKLMCHYFSYFSATPVRTFLNVAQWEEIDQNYVNGFPIIFLLAANGTFWTQKWDVSLDLLPPPAPLSNPIDEKLRGISKKNYKQKKWRKLSRNYTPNWKNCWLEETYFWKFPPTVTSGRTIKDEKGQQVHENFIKGDSAWKLY